MDETLEARLKSLKRGSQIVYVPTHAEGRKNHPDCEEGFVTSVRGTTVFCRYWSKHSPGLLRTMANSEGTPIENIVVVNTHLQAEVDRWLRIIDAEEAQA